MNIVDSKSSQMNEVLVFRTHLVEHFAWRRIHHGNPSPATWSRRRLHDPISSTRQQPRRSDALWPACQRRSLSWPVCQTAEPISQTPATNGLRSSQTNQPGLRQLPAVHRAHQHRYIHSACSDGDSRQFTGSTRSTADTCSPAAAGSATAAPGCFGSVDCQSQFGRQYSKSSHTSHHGRGYRAPASHRSCARRSTPTASRARHQSDFSPYSFITHGGGL